MLFIFTCDYTHAINRPCGPGLRAVLHLDDYVHAEVPESLTTVTVENQHLNAEITQQEVLNAVNSTKLHKAAGPDRLQYKHLKLSLPLLLPLWTHLFNACVANGVVPNSWRYSVLTVLYKSKGPILSPDSYRGISKQCCIFKILCKILPKRLY